MLLVTKNTESVLSNRQKDIEEGYIRSYMEKISKEKDLRFVLENEN